MFCLYLLVDGNTKSKVCKTTRGALTAHMTLERGLVLILRAGILFDLHRLCVGRQCIAWWSCRICHRSNFSIFNTILIQFSKLMEGTIILALHVGSKGYEKSNWKCRKMTKCDFFKIHNYSLLVSKDVGWKKKTVDRRKMT